MEKRKLQKTGGSSLTITLPKKWTGNLKLRDKDVINVYSQKIGNLILHPASSKQNSTKAEFKIDDLPKERLIRELISHYLSGANQIVIKSQKITLEQRSEIRNLTNAFIGFEIIDESTQEIVIKNILDDTKFPIPQRIEKMFLIAQTMFKDTFIAFSQNDKLLAEDIIERDFEIDKLNRTITRQFHSLISFKIFEEEIGIDYIDLNYYEKISNQIERIADHVVKIAKSIIATPDETLKKVASSKNLVKVTQKMIAILVDAAMIVEKLDKQLAHEVLDKNHEVEKIITMKKHPKSEAYQEVYQIEIITDDSFDRIRGYIMNIAEMTIDQSVLQVEFDN